MSFPGRTDREGIAQDRKRLFDVGREVLKIIAVATMTVDHVGAILFPEYSFLRIIGRLAFPIFAYLLVLGVGSTGNMRDYFARLLLFALISEVPYFFAFGTGPLEQLNIFFTLFFGGLLIYLMRKRSLLTFLPFVAAVFLNAEGGFYGIAVIACMEILRESIVFGVLALSVLNLAFSFVWDIQPLSLLALPIILLHKQGWLRLEKETRQSTYHTFNKYLFYVYYPLHLAVLYIVKLYFF